MNQGGSPERIPAARSPRNIAQYAIHGRLGKGAMGVVYRAVDERSGEPVALKVIASDLEGDEEVRARFFREVVVAGQLRHRNIVAVLDSGEDEGRLYLAMELLSGTTLGAFLGEPEFADLELRIDLMIQICQGLSVAHEAGVYHRDIKPGNLFISADHRVKILDFGVARLAGSNMTVTGYVLGTPDFMSPEQARGMDVDERSDVFSAGAVFYLMLTGRKPFAADDLPAVLTKVLRENPQPIRAEEAPLQLATVIHKALSKNPAGRHQNMAELTADLMRAADALVASTRQRALAVRASGEELARVEAHSNERRCALGLSTGSRSEWAELSEQYPMLRRGPRVLGLFPLRATVVDAIAKEVEQRLAGLRQEIEVLDEAHREWSEATRLLSTGQESEAASHLAAARRLVPESPVVAECYRGCNEALESKHERETRSSACLQRAEDAAAQRDWDAVLAAAAELDDIAPGHADALRLRRFAQQNKELDRQRLAREQADRQAALVLQEARELAGREQFDEAIARLDAHLLANPNAPGIADELKVIQHRHQALRARRERITEAAALAQEARAALESGDLDRAQRAAVRAVGTNAEDAEAARLLPQIRLAITERDEQLERARRIAELVERAKTLRERQKLTAAIAVLEEALALDVEQPEVVALRAQFVAAAEEQQRLAEAAALQERRRRAAAPAVREAQIALAAGDFRLAQVAVEIADARAPGLPEVQSLMQQIAAKTPPRGDDDTVRVASPGTDDRTARLAPMARSWREAADHLKDRAAEIWRRFQSTAGR